MNVANYNYPALKCPNHPAPPMSIFQPFPQFQSLIALKIELILVESNESNFIILLMSNNDKNLLNFLKQNSLFTNSPNKNGLRKSKSRSKDKTESKGTPTKPREPYFQDPYQKTRSFAPQDNYNAPLEPNRNFTPLQTNNIKFTPPLHDSRFNTFDDLEDKRDHRPFENRGIAEPKQNNELWAGLSARIESAHCLENLGMKVRNEIANVNIKIENFNTRMYRVITDEFKNLRERLLFIIDESFKEGEKYIREYMKSQEDKLAGDLLKIREVLQKEYAHIEAMKEEIGKPNWRKTAGEIIASELESKVEEAVKRSSQLNVGKWELGDLVGYRLKDLERDLRDAVRLKRQA